MQCYGHFRQGDPECASCQYARWCRDAGDPPLAGGVDFEKVSNVEDAITIEDAPLVDEPETESDSELHVTSGEWMALVRRILEIDDKRIRTILRLKLENPNISLAEIGRYFGITKQMVDKEIDFACHWMPELSIVLRNRPMYNRWRGIATNSPGNPSRVRRHYLEVEQLTLPIDDDTE